MSRVAVFIDYQNVYMRARDTFADRSARNVEGQVDPFRVGMLLTDRGMSVDDSRSLESVRVFRGEPSPKHSPIGQAACQRQVAAWRLNDQVEVTTRPLRYLPSADGDGPPRLVGREKGVDVLLALSMVLGAERNTFDVCVLFSADTDLLPALEYVREIGKVVEVAAWKPDRGYSSSLSLPGMWCHRLDRYDYEAVADRIDYAAR